MVEKNFSAMAKPEPLKLFDLPDQQFVAFRIKGASHIHGGTFEGRGYLKVELPPGIRRLLRYPLLPLIEALPD